MQAATPGRANQVDVCVRADALIWRHDVLDEAPESMLRASFEKHSDAVERSNRDQPPIASSSEPRGGITLRSISPLRLRLSERQATPAPQTHRGREAPASRKMPHTHLGGVQFLSSVDMAWPSWEAAKLDHHHAGRQSRHRQKECSKNKYRSMALAWLRCGRVPGHRVRIHSHFGSILFGSRTKWPFEASDQRRRRGFDWLLGQAPSAVCVLLKCGTLALFTSAGTFGFSLKWAVPARTSALRLLHC